MKNIKCLSLFAGLLSVAAVAANPGSVSTQKYGVANLGLGTGVKLSDDSQSRLHLGLDVGLGYNSNPYYYAIDDTNHPLDSRWDMILKVKPIVSLMAGGRKLSLQMGVDGDLGALLGVNPNAKADFLLFNGAAHGRGEFNKDGAISFFAAGNILSRRQVTQLFLGSMTNVNGDVSAGTTIRLGNGPLKLTLDGQYQIQNYTNLQTQQTASSTPNGLNNNAAYGHAKLDWSPSSKMDLYLDAKYGSWVNQPIADFGLGVTPLWASLGLRLPMGNHVTTNFALGYANAMIKSAGVLQSTASVPVIGQAEADWQISETSHGVLGVKRDMMPTAIFLDIYSNSAYLKFDQRFARKFVLSLSPTVTLNQSGKPWGAAGANPRTDATKFERADVMVDGQIQLTYFIKEWFGIGVSGAGNWRWANITTANALKPEGQYSTQSSLFPMNLLYNRYEGVLFLSFNY